MKVEACILEFEVYRNPANHKNILLRILAEPLSPLGAIGIETGVKREGRKYCVNLPLRRKRREAVEKVVYSEDFQNFLSAYSRKRTNTRERMTTVIYIDSSSHQPPKLGILAYQGNRGMCTTVFTPNIDE